MAQEFDFDIGSVVGNGIRSASFDSLTNTLTLTFTDGTSFTTPSLKGAPGEDGESPVVTVTSITGGHRVTITDEDHPSGQSFDVMDGADGDDGYSPTVTVTEITGGHRVTITDKTGPHTFDVMDGEGGGGAVSDVQINGTSIVNAQGVANIPRATDSTEGAVKVNGVYGVKISNGVLFAANPSLNEIKSGVMYKPPSAQQAHQATFYGLAKAAGDATQSASANAVGAYTEDAKSAIHEMLNGSVAVSGTTPTIAAKAGISYVCGEVATLDITLPASGCFDVVFISGSTPTVLTATGVTWANDFDATALEADTTYEINIKDGLGVVQKWT